MKSLEAQVQAVTKLLAEASALQEQAAELIAEADPPNGWLLEPSQAQAEVSARSVFRYSIICKSTQCAIFWTNSRPSNRCYSILFAFLLKLRSWLQRTKASRLSSPILFSGLIIAFSSCWY